MPTAPNYELYGTGVTVAYGKNNNVSINGTLTANGYDANTVHFEFGANAFGGTFEYRGSYLRYTGDINDWYGKLIGTQINGDINSVWKQFDEDEYGLQNTAQTVTYQETQRDDQGNITGFEVKPGRIEPLYIQYKGNIGGFDNMKMNVTSGTLYYGGAANVVNVLGGANLFGGNDKLYDMTARMAEGFSDAAGKFINHGTIGAMTINGKIILATFKLPAGETAQFLAAANVTGNLANATAAAPVSGMLNNTGALVGNTIKTTAHASNNLGNMISTQAASFDSANEMATARTVLERERFFLRRLG